MRLKRHAAPVLRQSALRPLPLALTCRCTQHRHGSSSAAYPERIAILGGGVAGLSSAYFVSREFPKSKITLFEAGKQTGGWIRSKRLPVPGGHVIFELGPRTLRNATVTAHLCQELDLVKDMTFTTRNDAAAKNRFVYYPDRLNRLPSAAPALGDLFALWRSGILAGASGLIKEAWKPWRSHLLTDETVGSFLERRVDRRIANNVVSAVFHGIYAGDIWNLSAKTLLSQAWQLEGKYGSAMRGFFAMQAESQGGVLTLAHPFDIEASRAMSQEFDIDDDFVDKMRNASTFTFKGGLQQIDTALKRAVHKTGNVDIKTESPVLSTQPLKEKGQLGVSVTTGTKDKSTTASFDLAISTLRSPSLTPYVTVQTINLFYTTPNLNPPGFGYLIPQSVPFEQNPERALGVIFDSSATSGQDTAPGTKFTVMLGGHWWNGWASFPSDAEALDMAKSVLARHLGIKEEPAVSYVNLSQDCIPQYTVGYEDRLRDFARGIGTEFGGRLRVVGNQFNGVGVNDVITGAWNMARGLRGYGWKSGSVGLDKVSNDMAWVPVLASDLAYKKRGLDGAGQ
ncbi:oxygen-dependent protoporphyrinogen oxidase [Pleosporales sp. CAS-2024a]